MRRFWRVALSCLVLLMAVSVLSVMSGCGDAKADAIGKLQAPKGKVQLKSGTSGAWADATDKMAVSVGDTVKTGDNGSVTMVWNSGDAQEFQPGAAFRFDGKVLNGEQSGGTVVYRATKKSEEVKVTTPHAVTGILGTTFAETVSATATEIVLAEGKLSIRNRKTNQETTLEAGQRLVIDDSGKPSPPAPLNPFDSEALFHPNRSGAPTVNPQ